MKSLLRNDRVYRVIMNGGLWIVVIAALFTTKWPQLTWVTGCITAFVVAVVATVYWIAVVTNDTDKPNSKAEHQGEPIPDEPVGAVAAREVTGGSPSQHRADIRKAYRAKFSKMVGEEREKKLLLDKAFEQRRRMTWEEGYFGALSHHGSKSRRRADLECFVAGEEDTGGKVVLMIGSVRIEIDEDELTNVTNVHIASSKTLMTNVADTGERSRQIPQESSLRRGTTATIH